VFAAAPVDVADELATVLRPLDGFIESLLRRREKGKEDVVWKKV